MSIHQGFKDLTNAGRISLLKMADEVEAIKLLAGDLEGVTARRIHLINSDSLFKTKDHPLEVKLKEGSVRNIKSSADSALRQVMLQFNEVRIESPPKPGEVGKDGRELRSAISESVKLLAVASGQPVSYIKRLVKDIAPDLEMYKPECNA